ncbi:Adhesin YadA precursor [compost metagenome]
MAIGANSVATSANTVSFGSAGQTRGLVNVSAGAVNATSTDAVNGGQLYTVRQAADTAQAAASAANGTAVLARDAAGAAQGTANTALGAAQTAQAAAATAQSTANTATTAAATAQGTANTALGAAQGAQASATDAKATAVAAQGTANTALGVANNSVQYGAGGAQVALNANGGAGTTLSNVRAGVAATDAANVGQLQQVQQGALTTANTFTMQQIAALQGVMNQALSNGLCSFSGGNVTCGTGTQATGTGATALGTNATAHGDNTTAMGNGAQARYAGSVAIGAGAKALADPTTAVGNDAVATGNNAVALGANTLAAGSNSVALGQGSVATRDNSVSVGNAATGQTRSIANVAPGVLPTDAVNLQQAQQLTAAAVSEARSFAAKGVAAAMAMGDAPMPSAPGKTSWAAQLANYKGHSAMGASVVHRLATDMPLALSAGVSGSSGSVGVRVGLKGEF